MAIRDHRIPPKTHSRHRLHKHLPVCGGGANGLITGNVKKATLPCRMCYKGGK